MSLLALDPGLRKAGVALFDEAGRLGVAALARNSVRGRGGAAWLGMRDAVINACADLPDEAAIEVMQIDGRGAPPADLLELNGVAGAVLGWVGAGKTYTPKQWKGSVPKDVHHRRAKASLSKDELGVLTRSGHAAQKDVLDAVALGLFHLGRLA